MENRKSLIWVNLEGGGEIGLSSKFLKCDFAAKNAFGPVLGVPNFLFFDNRACES